MWLLLMLVAFLFNGCGVFGLRILAGMGLTETHVNQYLLLSGRISLHGRGAVDAESNAQPEGDWHWNVDGAVQCVWHSSAGVRLWELSDSWEHCLPYFEWRQSFCRDCGRSSAVSRKARFVRRQWMCSRHARDCALEHFVAVWAERFGLKKNRRGASFLVFRIARKFI